MQQVLINIGIDGKEYEEIFVTDYEAKIQGLRECLGEYESLEELNYLAALISELDAWEIEKLEGAIAYGESTSSVKDLINLTQNLDSYEYLHGVENEDDLGRYHADSLSIPNHLNPYIDFSAIGRDIALESGGVFTSRGYIEQSGERMIEHYRGIRDIPEQYRLFGKPRQAEKEPISVQLSKCQKPCSQQKEIQPQPHRVTER